MLRYNIKFLNPLCDLSLPSRTSRFEIGNFFFSSYIALTVPATSFGECAYHIGIEMAS